MRSRVAVVTPAETYALTALDTIKEELPGTTIPDATLSRWIQEASSTAATYCGRVLASEEVTETFYLTGTPTSLPLSRWPVSSLDTVTLDGVALDPADYQVDEGTGFLYRLDADANETYWSGSRVVVEYTGGYTILGTLPRDIEAAVLALVKRRAYTYSQDPNLRVVDVVGVGRREWWVSPTSSDPMPTEIMAMLDPYRAVVM